MRPTLVQSALILNGVILTFAGVSLLVAPQWFFDVFAPFPPFNRHFLGDAGAFSLPWGIALLLAARAPHQHRLLLALATGAASLHALNHLFGDLWVEQLPWDHLLSDNAPIALPTLWLVWACVKVWREGLRDG